MRISTSPPISLIRQALSIEECDTLIRLALPRMRESRVTHVDREASHVHYSRASRSGDLVPIENEFTKSISARIAEACNATIEQVETLQVVRYDPGQFFLPHYDFFLNAPDGTDSAATARYENEGGQRLETFLIFLNRMQPGELGGCTHFPRLHLQFSAEPGNGIIWNNSQQNGEVEVKSEHAGSATELSTKFVLVSWIRQHAVNYYR